MAFITFRWELIFSVNDFIIISHSSIALMLVVDDSQMLATIFSYIVILFQFQNIMQEHSFNSGNSTGWKDDVVTFDFWSCYSNDSHYQNRINILISTPNVSISLNCLGHRHWMNIMRLIAHVTSVVLMESFKQATGFFKAAHCVYLVGRIFGVSAFTYSYGPSKRVYVRSKDVFFLLVPLCASVFTLLNYLYGGPLLSKTFKLKSPLFEVMLDFMNINSSVASTMLILYQFFHRKKYWALLVEIDSIDFEVSDSDIPPLRLAK